MEKLQYLCDIANGKHRRWFKVRKRAAELFGKWVRDWHSAETIDEVLDKWEMGHLLDDHLRVQTKCVGKRIEIDRLLPISPWTDDGLTELAGVNEELLYLILSFLTADKCEYMHVCPECGEWFIALHLRQKYCSSLCGRRSNSRRIVGANNAKKRNQRIEACRVAFGKYCRMKMKPRGNLEKYVLAEANRNLHSAYKLGGSKMQFNFITRNAREIGILK